MKSKYLVSLLVICGLFLFPIKGQCDLVLTDVDLEAGTFTIDFVNTTNCGGTGGPDGVSEIQIGFQALDPDNNCAAMNQGWTFPSGITIPDNSNHPGWIFSSTSNEQNLFNWTNLWPDWPWDIDPPYYAGETITFPLYNQYQNDCVNGPFANGLSCQLEDALTFWIDEGYSIQAVIWQISYGPTMYAADGGWAEVGVNGDGTSWGSGLYEDSNFLDNWLIIGPCSDSWGCTDSTACNYDPEATTDDGSCIYCDVEICDDIAPWCYGCTDPIALNYDDEAVINDSTCVYSTGPDLITIDFEILDQECLADGETHIVTYEITVVNIGTEDVGQFCMSTFLSPSQTNCPFVIDINPLDTATFQGSFQASWFSGQNNYVTLSSVEGLNGQPEIITGNNNFVFSMPEFEECDYTDIEANNLNIVTECTNGISKFKLTFSGENLGNDVITNYCYTWGEVDGITQTACVSSDGTYPNNNTLWEIPVGQTQNITSGWVVPSSWCGEYFAEFTNVNGEPTSLTTNNFTSDFFPDDPCFPDTIYVELPPDTITEIEYILDTLIITTVDTTYIELPPDTILITQIDTIIDIQTVIDTLYIELPPDTITLIETEFVYDTTFIELPPDTITLTETEFIFVTDTIYETEIIYITDSLYITLTDTVVEYQFIEIDCSTGLPCSNLGFDECDPLTIYIPNTFTPNNDGVNDVWEVVIDPDCWTDVEAKVYNRWGDLMWESYDPYYLLWNGSNMNGSYYVPDGVYYWSFNGRKINTAVIEELQGHVTLFR